MTRPEAVLFDLGNVLVSIHPERFLQTLGIDLKPEGLQYQKKIIEIVGLYERGEATTDEYFRSLGGLFDHAFPRSRLQEAMLSVIGSPILGMEKLVRAVGEKTQLALVSNTNELHFNYCLARVPVLQHFQRYFLSYQLLASKPEPFYYAKVLQRLSIPPSDILFIDDLPENIRGATSAGMNALLFSSASELESALHPYQIL